MTTAAIPLPALPVSAAAARAVVDANLRAVDVSEDCRFVVRLLVDELVTNAIFHAGTDADLLVCRDGTHLRVEVVDYGPGVPNLRYGDPDADNGRGLRVVSELADQWGVIREPAWKATWFEVDLGRPDPFGRRPS